MAATLDGELSFARVPALLAQVPALASAGTVDLSAVTRADSAGLALLLELTRRARRDGHALRFTHAPAQLMALATFFGLGEALSLDPA